MIPIGMKSGFAFADNPILFRGLADDSEESVRVKGGSFKVMLGSKNIYEGKFTLPVYLDLSDIVVSELLELTNPSLHSWEWIRAGSLFTEGCGSMLNLIVEYDNGGDWESGPIFAMRGRVTSKKYNDSSKVDIFSERFLNPKENFFMTTRTSGPLIEIPETEVYPLGFLMPGGKKIKVEAGGTTLESGILSKGFYWIDPNAIRKIIFDDSLGMKLVNEFKVGYSDSESRVNIVITRSEPSVSRVRFRYRNSYDIPELICFNGELSVVPKLEENPGRRYMRYIRGINDYTINQEGAKTRLAMTLDTGPVAAKDLRRLLELISSRKVDLESPADGSWISVVISAENIEFPLRPETPLNYKLNVEAALEDLSLLDMLNPESAEPWKIFSIEHNEKFN